MIGGRCVPVKVARASARRTFADRQLPDEHFDVQEASVRVELTSQSGF
jgi:hypothetical protein